MKSESCKEVERCFTCTYWKGDKEEARKLFAMNPLAIDLEEGWMVSGECEKEHMWMAVEMSGNCSVAVMIDGHFSCPYWEGDGIEPTTENSTEGTILRPGPFIHRETGERYEVITATNQHATKAGWPVMVVYHDEARRIWSRPISEFIRKFVRQDS